MTMTKVNLNHRPLYLSYDFDLFVVNLSLYDGRYAYKFIRKSIPLFLSSQTSLISLKLIKCMQGRNLTGSANQGLPD